MAGGLPRTSHPNRGRRRSLRRRTPLHHRRLATALRPLPVLVDLSRDVQRRVAEMPAQPGDLAAVLERPLRERVPQRMGRPRLAGRADARPSSSTAGSTRRGPPRSKTTRRAERPSARRLVGTEQPREARWSFLVDPDQASGTRGSPRRATRPPRCRTGRGRDERRDFGSRTAG